MSSLKKCVGGAENGGFIGGGAIVPTTAFYGIDRAGAMLFLDNPRKNFPRFADDDTTTMISTMSELNLRAKPDEGQWPESID